MFISAGKIVLTAFLVFILSSLSLSSSGLAEDSQTDVVDLKPMLELLPSTNAIQRAEALEYETQWTQAYSPEGEKLAAFSGNWYRLNLGDWSQKSSEWVLLFPLAQTFKMFRQQQGDFKATLHGYRDSSDEKIKFRKTAILLSNLQPQETLYFWVAGSSKRSSYSPEMVKWNRFVDSTSKEYMLSAISYSFFFCIAMLAFFTFVATRETIYLLYGGYLVATMGLFLGIQGYGYQFFSMWSPGLSMFSFGIANALILVFIERLFVVVRRSLKMLIQTLAVLSVVFGVVVLVSSVPKAFGLIYSVGVTIQFLIAIIAFSQSYRSKENRWLSLFVGINFLISGLGFLNDRVSMPFSDVIDAAFIPITLIEALLFLVTLWKRYALVIEEKKEALEMAQQKTLESLRLRAEKDKLKLQAAVGESAAQVAHDIRSPLSALSLIMGHSSELPEEKRILIRDAVHRINDIANELLAKSKRLKDPRRRMAMDGSKQEKVLLASLVDSIVSEKRTEYRERQGVNISIDISNAYGLFICVSSMELKRVLSNLINNSIEAMSGSAGPVIVNVFSRGNEAVISVRDSGPGIPEKVISGLGEWGLSDGKVGASNGSGLGLYHAKKTMDASGGQLKIINRPGAGATIELIFPKAAMPIWFVDQLLFEKGIKVISIDDDISIHQVWRERIEELRSPEVLLPQVSFTSAQEFEQWFHLQASAELEKCFFLIDFELIGQGVTGLEIIKKHGLAKQAVLVTSRYEENSVQQLCEETKVRIIPKTMASLVPLNVAEDSKVLPSVPWRNAFITNEPILE
ncbi:MAG: Histidine kinase [Pseudomonadota bacterium]|jgi:signal transduction histidine kinase